MSTHMLSTKINKIYFFKSVVCISRKGKYDEQLQIGWEQAEQGESNSERERRGIYKDI